MAVYISFGVPAVHLIAASVMAAPGALVISKLMFPEDGEPETRGTVRAEVERPWVNAVDAAASGASDGMKLALNVGAMLIAFLALLALVNALLGWGGGLVGMPQLSLEWLFARASRAGGVADGHPLGECGTVGVLLGKKIAAQRVHRLPRHEDAARQRRSSSPAAPRRPARRRCSPTARSCSPPTRCAASPTSARSRIQIGGIGGLAPNRQHDLARLGVRALIAGALTNFVNACIAGMLL